MSPGETDQKCGRDSNPRQWYQGDNHNNGVNDVIGSIVAIGPIGVIVINELQLLPMVPLDQLCYWIAK